MNIGLIGAGAIGEFLLKEINYSAHDSLTIKSVLVRNREKYQGLESEYGVQLFTDLDGFLDSDIDIVVEAATVEAVKNLLPEIIKKKDAMLISVGALADDELVAEVTGNANEYDHALHLPSGAIGGLDLLQNAQTFGKLDSVTLETRKPAASLVDEAIDEEKVVFEGSAVDAIEQFPKNMNVSIILSFAGVGLRETAVTLIADPNIDKNIHHIKATGDFGEAEFTFKNNPLPENPKTSYLAALSVCGTLERIYKNVKIGS
ncbi:aspartate dehydrogenase [Salinicoccus sp. HZC-1]|uniref:aspartate dehydrogenase n=1 Tax=Salinicoccus sp. HZC-1 TaxID=3385497 RepID=UPI00398B0753